MELYILVRFRANEGSEKALEQALVAVVPPSRGETGCIDIHAFRSTRDAQLFYIHSRWVDEAAFELHAMQPHTVDFIRKVEPLIGHPLEVTRATMIG